MQTIPMVMENPTHDAIRAYKTMLGHMDFGYDNSHRDYVYL
jgi:hypothetical protein